MASKIFHMSSKFLTDVTKAIFHSSPQTARCLLQHQSLSPSTVSRVLSSFPLATFFGNTPSYTKSEASQPISLLNMCGSQARGTVLANAFKPGVPQIRNYHSKIRPRLICEGCYFVWRHGRKFVECSDHPRHKQMKKLPTRKIWQEDYSKGNIAKAMDWHKRYPREFARTADKMVLSHNWLAGKLGKEL